MSRKQTTDWREVGEPGMSAKFPDLDVTECGSAHECLCSNEAPPATLLDRGTVYVNDLPTAQINKSNTWKRGKADPASSKLINPVKVMGQRPGLGPR